MKITQELEREKRQKLQEQKEARKTEIREKFQELRTLANRYEEDYGVCLVSNDMFGGLRVFPSTWW